jgi:hypothetical protein
MHRHHERVSQALREQTPYVADAVAVRAKNTGNVLTIIGFVLTVVSAVSMLTAGIRNEPGWYLLLLLLLFFAFSAAMLL